MKKIIVIIAVSIVSLAANAQDKYAIELSKMLELNGTKETFQGVIDQMISLYQNQESDVPAEYWDKVKKSMSSSYDELVVKLVPVYKKHLTIEDLKGINDFYSTPVGKKLSEKTPLISQESMEIGQRWGMEIGTKIAQEMQNIDK